MPRVTTVDAPACAVGRLEPDGPWVGFAPIAEDGYAIVAGTDDGRAGRASASPADLAALAIVYFEDGLAEPPEELAATHGDIASIVRHVAERVDDPERRRAYNESVDAIDDGLAADVVIERLTSAFGGGDALAHLRRRVVELLGSS